MSIDLAQFSALVGGKAVAIRGTAILEPAGGPGDKVFPPSHFVDDKNPKSGAKYAFETRRVAGEPVRCVLIDSVQSQANRIEEALQSLWQQQRIRLPVIAVDFSTAAGISDLGRTITSLTAPHRIADALLRDCMLDGTLFRLSPLGKSFTDASIRDASALFSSCPTALVFGMWDSTGPKGGLGAKFARALVSEIVGLHATEGVKTSSRVDPASIVTKAATIYEAKNRDEGWTFDPKLAVEQKGKPVPYKDGKVSSINHSNQPPLIDVVAGGVTIDHARHSVVLSLAAIRRLGFGGDESEAGKARTVLAALALVGVLAAQERGHDLRSRCLLVPRPGHTLALEVVAGDGSIQPLSLGLDDATLLYEQAVAALPPRLRFEKAPGEPLATLVPAAKLAHLIRESRQIAAAGSEDEGS